MSVTGRTAAPAGVSSITDAVRPIRVPQELHQREGNCCRQHSVRWQDQHHKPHHVRASSGCTAAVLQAQPATREACTAVSALVHAAQPVLPA
jgi:hypothetical protein